VLPNWVGDVAMATPALRTLRKHLPDARIIGLAKPYLIPLLDGTKWLDTIIPWEHKGPGRFSRSIQTIRQLRTEELDILILFRASLSAGLLARLSSAKQTIGYARHGLGWLVSKSISPLHHGRRSEPVSAVDDYLHLIKQSFGFAANNKQLELTTSPANEAAADGLWKRLKLPPGEQVMLLNTGGAFGNAKHWPAEYSVSLALRATDEFGLTTLVLCGPGERADAAAIESAANHPKVKSLASEDVSFGTTKAIIRRSRLLVTTDSGPRHIASALNTPTIVLFGPIDPRWSRNYQRQSIELTIPLDCAPCGQRTCPLGHHRCMRDLTVYQVLKAVAGSLESTTKTREAA
jgi:heptosyltransferase-2